MIDAVSAQCYSRAETALQFVRFDHCLENHADGKRRFIRCGVHRLK